MSDEVLLDILASFERAHVLVLGDVMLDRFVYGSVERTSPEAPVPVLALQRTVYMPGGAANVARNVVALGARAELIGVVGADEAAANCAATCRHCPGLTAQLVIDPARPTTTKTRFVADRQQILRTDVELATALPAVSAAALLAQLPRRPRRTPTSSSSPTTARACSTTKSPRGHCGRQRRGQTRAGRSEEPVVREVPGRHRAHPQQARTAERLVATSARPMNRSSPRPARYSRSGICRTVVATRGQRRHVDHPGRRVGPAHPHDGDRGVRRHRCGRHGDCCDGGGAWPTVQTSATSPDSPTSPPVSSSASTVPPRRPAG